MAKEKIVRTGAAMNHGTKFLGKGVWSRVEDTKEFGDTHDNLNWADHKPEHLEVVKSELGKTVYKVKI